MVTRAKFVCQSVRKFQHWNRSKGFLYEAEFTAVSDGSEENKRFFDATPSASIKLATLSEDRFQPGREYYVDFTAANDQA